MSKTYTLTSTAMRGGKQTSWTSNYWTAYNPNPSSGSSIGTRLRVGWDGDGWCATNILFDAATLAALRGKTVTSIRLRITVASGTILADGNIGFQIGYKYNSSTGIESSSATDAWARGDRDSTSLSSTALAYITSGSSSNQTASNTVKEFDLTSYGVPRYGYSIGTRNAKNNYITLASTATLIVVTNETDFSFTLSYNANGGTGAPSSQTGSGTTTGTPLYTFTIPSTAPTRTGYTFVGWSKNQNSTTAQYQPGGSITVTANTTLYAVWSINTYTVSYNKGANGTGTNTTDTKTYGTALTLKGAIFTRTGYTQTGWSTTDGGAKAYNLSASYTTNAAVTLYPFWTINTWTVSYNKGANGTGTNTTDTKTYNVPLSLKGAIFTREGYYQSGWSVSDGGPQTYALSASYTNNAAVTLYPAWTPYKVSLQYNANGGSLITPHGESIEIDSQGYVTLNGTRNVQNVSFGNSADPINYNNPSLLNIQKDGFHVDIGEEWNTSPDGSGNTFGQAIEYAATDYAPNVTTGNRTIVLYANWKSDSYTISYDANGGTGAPSEQTKSYGTDLTLSNTIPTNGNLTFAGWATSPNATTAQYQPGGTYSANESATLYAVWTQSAFIRRMSSSGSLESIPLYVMTSQGLVGATLYRMSVDGTLHQEE